MKTSILFICRAGMLAIGMALPAGGDTTATRTHDPLLHPDSISAYADYLQEKGDYLRACGEYDRALACDGTLRQTGRLREQIARCYLKLRRYDTAAVLFGALGEQAPDDTLALSYGADRYCALMAAGESEKAVSTAGALKERTGSPRACAMEVAARLHRDDTAGAAAALHTFVPRATGDSAWRPLVGSWIARYESLPYKSTVTAALWSAVLPGSGKIYAGRPRDGLFTAGFLAFFSLQCYDGFHRHGYRSVKGWLFSPIVLDFYAANIYGSVLEVRSHNNRMKKDLLNDIELSLKVQVLGR